MQRHTEIVIPTRGMVHARTLESLKRNGLGDPIIISGLPIPDSHNTGVKKALESYPSYILILEDDVVMPDGAFEQMVKRDEAIVAVNYPMDNGYETICRHNEEILWCGMGCTLIKSGVFRVVPEPWFETDHSYRILEPFGLEKIDNPSKYGGLDINFCMKSRKYGFKIASLEGMEATHLRVRDLEHTDRSNNGLYEVYELPSISHRQEY